MNKKIYCFFLAVFLMIFFSVSAQAGNFLKGIAIGVGYPYLGVKYNLKTNISAEARIALDNYVQIYGARGCYTFTPVSEIYPFTGLELDYVIFDDKFVNGTGFVAYPFIGGEYFLIDTMSLSMDFGPAFISLKESDYDLTVSGFEWVVNMGFYFYFR